MEKSHSESYRKAGVDVTAGYRAVELIKKHAARTALPGITDSIGGFGGMFQPNLAGIEQPVLVSGTDGVGTKLKLAFLTGKHDTVGIDCVAMCVNDIVCCGAKPLIFLDYLAMGKNVPERAAEIVSGVAEGCVQAGCALVGGETAEMPGFYPENEYDLAGFSVGIADRSKLLNPEDTRPGDVLIGLASSGVHSNGFSLVRKVFDIGNHAEDRHVPELGGSLFDSLLTPTKIYVRPVLSLLNACAVRSIAHITGGGFYENIPRALSSSTDAVIRKGSFPTPPIFGLIQTSGNIPERDMYNTFNMGVGMVIIVDAEDADKAVRILREEGETAYRIGGIVSGNGAIRIE